MKYKIRDLGTVITGHTPSTKNFSYWNSNDVLFVCPPDLRYQRYVKKTEKCISLTGYYSCKTISITKDSIFVSCRATMGLVGISTCDCITNQDINTITKLNKQIIIPLFLYYSLLTKGDYFKSISYNGATLQNIKKTMFENIDVDVPTISEQQHIVDTIGSVDDLIEKNNTIIEKAKCLSTFMYNQYKEKSIGVSTQSFLKDCCLIRTGKLDANAANENGNYAFFTCSNDYSLIDKYAYEGKSIIVAGNGVINVRFYNGKFNAYQRVYVLQPKQNIFLYLKEIEGNIQNLLRGANGSVIKFITKGMLEEISIPINDETETTNDRIGKLYDYISKLENENIILNKAKRMLFHKYFD